jgi:hypothetical protein
MSPQFFPKEQPTMPLKKLLLLGVSLFLLSLAIPPTTGSSPNNYSIAGTVSDQQKKPLSGVMITAFDAVEDKTITVFTKEGGRFKLPGLTGRDYKLRARLPGFEDEFANVAYKSGSNAPSRFVSDRRPIRRCRKQAWTAFA